MKFIRLYFVGLLIVIGTVTPSAQTLMYHVEIENLDEVQPLTPPVAVVHSGGYSLFEVGSEATPGLELLAEEGITGDLVAEAEANADVSTVVVGGSGPTFGSFQFFIEGQPGDLFSVASMFAKTNDNFIGVSSVMLPSPGDSLTIESQAYDSGTEQNTGMAADIPAFGNVGVGPEEDGTVQVINSFTLQDDPELGQVESTWPPAANIIITPANQYTFELNSLSEGQPLTPPVVAVYDDIAAFFEVGGTASEGLEILAEEGMTADLISELESTMGISSVGAFGDGPGPMQSGTFYGVPGQLMTIVSMFARTNDVITGAMSMELPEAGNPVSLETNAYDAGTEENTGLMADIPFYGNVGAGPEEDGSIEEINEFTVVDDPEGELTFSWPPAASLMVEAEEPTSNVGTWNLYR